MISLTNLLYPKVADAPFDAFENQLTPARGIFFFISDTNCDTQLTQITARPHITTNLAATTTAHLDHATSHNQSV